MPPSLLVGSPPIVIIGVAADPALVAEAAARSRFERTKKVEAERGHTEPERLTEEFRFLRSGKVGGWRKAFTEADPPTTNV